MLDRFVERLATRLPNDAASAEQVDDGLNPTHSPSVLAILDAVFRRMPLFIEQQRRIRRAWRESERRNVVALAVTSKRLGTIPKGLAPRSYVAALLAPLPGTDDGGVSDIFSAEHQLLLCDPVAGSAFWEDAGRCWRDHVYVVDIAYLLFVLCTSPTACARAFRRFALFIASRLTGRDRQRVSIIEGFRGSFLAEGYRTVLEPVSEIATLLLTSNSLAAETLRFAALEDRRCTTVVEVLHGVPTREYEDYLVALKAIGQDPPTMPRQEVIAQLPELPLHPQIGLRAGAINTFFNQYQVRRQALGDFETDVLSEVERLLIREGVTDDTRIVTVLGAMAHDRDYMLSRMFRVESAMLETVASLLGRAGRPYVILYTPHPLNRVSRFVARQPFSSGRVRLYHDTTLGHLIADDCVGLLSSALFEAKYCGCRVYTPVLISDNLFNPALLGRLNDGSASSDPAEGLRLFLQERETVGKHDVRSRARRRAACLWGLRASTSIGPAANRTIAYAVSMGQ